MTIEYQKTWEVMNQLEESFNKIAAVEFMVEELNDAVNQNETDRIVDISHALLAYLPVYISHYEKASRRAWNNTVLKVAEQDVPYRNDAPSMTVDEVKYSIDEE